MNEATGDKPMFAIFILKGNKWELHMRGYSQMALALELDYVINQLGMTAKIFKEI